ncbi:MAG TPA: PAS domain-containing protein [Geobacteraceae bacterium]|nr:PAS domain-containing protein [Geobacteraceae bacterium]
MAAVNRPAKELLAEIEDLRIRLEEAEETLRAIGSGEVDAFVVSGPEGPQVFTLKGAEQPYRVLVETMNEGAATLTPDGTILYCNNRLAAMLRVPLERLIGTQLGSYVAPADIPLFSARLERCAGECDKDEITMITAAGTPIPTMISCCSLDLSGNRQVSLVVTDLSQQKRNEEIVAAERLARSIIEQAGESIIVCDEGGRIIRASRSTHQLCGENPLLKQFNELFQLHIIETECLFSVSTPLAGGCLESVEVELNRCDGETFHLLLNATPLKCEESRIIGCVVTLTDFTERRDAEESLRQSEERLQAANEELQSQREELQSQNEELQKQSEELQAQNRELERLWEKSKRAEEALNRLNEELEERVKERTAELREKDQILLLQSRQAAMGEMIGNIAHQWRQPLNALGLIVQQTVLFYDLGELNREVLNKNASQAMELIRHMSRTIDDFRNYFRPDKEKVEFKVRESISNTLLLVAESFKQQHIDIEVVAKDDPVIFGYKNEFAQVLLNIMNNARDVLTERGIGNPKVTITSCCEDGCVVVTVADNAGGISEEVMEKVFDPYFTTKGAQLGTGVGLFMSKSIIEKNMGGRLTVRNTACGAEFRVEV